YQLFVHGFSVYNTSAEESFIKENYAKAENVSVDYAIMEDSSNVYVLPATFDWNDLGTWGSLFEKLDSDENDNVVINAKSLTINSTNNLVRTDKQKLVVLDSLQDYIIVDKEDVLLVFPKENEQHIKKTLELVKSKFGSDYS
ncbi:MAG: mannose-1-phosphate guanylyltransferase, partial [Flavobacteriaceae bacterium]|nr:mannose-1-phosphate guanylyltransferase [Flavobacteriaceae bacterium]